jgi:transposase-like protein
MAEERKRRERISLLEFTKRFDTEEKAMRFFEGAGWKEGRRCPYCDSDKTREATHKTMPYWCGACRKYFSVKTGTLMQGSRISYLQWLTAIYLIRTSPKGIPSTKLGADLGISQQSAWFLGHRIRKGWEKNIKEMFFGKVEADETYIGGLESNKHAKKRRRTGRGGSGSGKETVLGIRERGSKRVKAILINPKKETTLGVLLQHVSRDSRIYTDQGLHYTPLKHLGYGHESVNHKAGEYVRGDASTNGIESFWALLKRGYKGTYHWMSPKHLQRYLDEFTGRLNTSHLDTMDQVRATVRGLVGKRLTYKELVS